MNFRHGTSFVASFLLVSLFLVHEGAVTTPFVQPNAISRPLISLSIRNSNTTPSYEENKNDATFPLLFRNPLHKPRSAVIGSLELLLKKMRRATILLRSKFFCFTDKRLSRWLRRFLAGILFVLTIHFTALAPVDAAGSSGRMGGSFGSSGSRRTTSRLNNSPTRIRAHYYTSPWSRTPPRGPSYRVIPLHCRSHLRDFSHPARRTESTTSTLTNIRTDDHLRVSLSDVVLVIGAASWVAYGVSKHYQSDGGSDSPLGPGVSVMSLTACLNVPDRDDPCSILQRLSQLAHTTNTSDRKGLQNLMAETSLELARQDKAVVSVESHYLHRNSATQAERRFNQLSSNCRSKFEKESLGNYGGKQTRMENTSKSPSELSSPATVALVNIHLAIEGNSLRAFDRIRSRSQLKEALLQVSSDVLIDDCLLAAEVIWSPEDPSEQMTMEDIFADFPTLYTLID